MTTATVKTRSLTALWWGICAAPVAWSLDELASLYVHESACNVFRSPHVLGLPATTVVLAVIGFLTGAVAMSGVVIAWTSRTELGQDTGEGATVPDQRRFMAHAGVILSGVFLFGIVLRVLTTFIIPPCRYL
jgi:hypothetical protein